MIHSTAVISSLAQIANNVNIGPFCVIGDNVVLEEGVELKSHVIVSGNTRIGKGTQVFQFAVIGEVPQDRKYQGEDSEVVIGQNNVIREHVTIQPGTKYGRMLTEIGDNCLLMVGVHVGHDCKIGNNVIAANYANFAGFVDVGNHAVIGGMSAIRQYVRIGDYAMLAGMSGLNSDLIPFGLAVSERAKLVGLNLIGMRRHNFDHNTCFDAEKVVKNAFGKISCTQSEVVDLLSSSCNQNFIIDEIVKFLLRDRKRPFCDFN